MELKLPLVIEHLFGSALRALLAAALALHQGRGPEPQ